ncbi:MAG: phosphoribosylanthranilate isomerase, partial [SAR202 cluster bacterium]|nr:phosphoribosylanthranilate isomerase [SAR202 cluster bacterium]
QQAVDIVSAYRQQHGPGGPKLVGLFADQPLDEVNGIVDACGLDYAQLCGDEPPEYWKQVAVPIIKQIKVHSSPSPLEGVGQSPLPLRERAYGPRRVGAHRGEGEATPEDVDAILEHTLRRVEEVLAAGHKALLDSYEPGHLGGTGRTFDWAVARRIAQRHDIVLAGGLTPDNVGEAIAAVRPWGVDVSSGVETGGVKDDAKIRAFAAAVRKADNS